MSTGYDLYREAAEELAVLRSRNKALETERDNAVRQLDAHRAEGVEIWNIINETDCPETNTVDAIRWLAERPAPPQSEREKDGESLMHVVRVAKDYVKAVKCTCEFTQDGVPKFNCWRCCFEYNLGFVNAPAPPQSVKETGK